MVKPQLPITLIIQTLEASKVQIKIQIWAWDRLVLFPDHYTHKKNGLVHQVQCTWPKQKWTTLYHRFPFYKWPTLHIAYMYIVLHIDVQYTYTCTCISRDNSINPGNTCIYFNLCHSREHTFQVKYMYKDLLTIALVLPYLHVDECPDCMNGIYMYYRYRTLALHMQCFMILFWNGDVAILQEQSNYLDLIHWTILNCVCITGWGQD